MTDLVAASAAFMRTADRLPTLYQLSEEWEALVELLEEENPDEEAVFAALQAVAGDIRRKAYGAAALTKTLERMAEIQDAESDRLARKAKANKAHAQRIREFVLDAMKRIDQPRIETGTFTLAIRQNNPSVLVEDASAVPSEYERTKIIVEVDKLAILKHYRETGDIPLGVSIARTERLDIR